MHGFRFLAASLVIFSHIELFKRRAGLENIWESRFFFEAGGAGVDFFFVLSGFLITSLLLKEKEYAGKINLRNFYLRRILRIWPLYYLVLMVCYFLVPYISLFYIAGYSEGIHVDFWSKFIYSFFLMPNVALAFFKDIPYAAPLWSIGVEEQFYLFWPMLLFLRFSRLKVIFAFVCCLISVKALLIIANSFFNFDPVVYEKVKNWIVGARMECMGIGAIGAHLVYTRHRIWLTMRSNLALFIALIGLFFVFMFAHHLFELHHIMFSVLFLVIILNGATNDNTPVKLEKRFLLMLGNVSYGVYLWHSLCVGLILNLLMSTGFHLLSGFLFNIVLYLSSFTLSVVVAWISYNYFETYFLRKKSHFSVIASGRDAIGKFEKDSATVKDKLVKPI